MRSLEMLNAWRVVIVAINALVYALTEPGLFRDAEKIARLSDELLEAVSVLAKSGNDESHVRLEAHERDEDGRRHGFALDALGADAWDVSEVLPLAPPLELTAQQIVDIASDDMCASWSDEPESRWTEILCNAGVVRLAWVFLGRGDVLLLESVEDARAAITGATQENRRIRALLDSGWTMGDVAAELARERA